VPVLKFDRFEMPAYLRDPVRITDAYDFISKVFRTDTKVVKSPALKDQVCFPDFIHKVEDCDEICFEIDFHLQGEKNRDRKTRPESGKNQVKLLSEEIACP